MDFGRASKTKNNTLEGLFFGSGKQIHFKVKTIGL